MGNIAKATRAEIDGDEDLMNGKSIKFNIIKRSIIPQGKELYGENNPILGKHIQDTINQAHDELNRSIRYRMAKLDEWYDSELIEHLRVCKKPVKIDIRDWKGSDLICTVVIKAKIQYFTNLEYFSEGEIVEDV